MRFPPDLWLLVSDVDDTLLGNDEGLIRFAQAMDDHPNLKVCLNSSRPTQSIWRTLSRSTSRIQPHAIIGAMGTEISVEGEPLTHWFETAGDWSRDPFDHLMNRLGFEPHAPEFQTKHKASFHVPSHGVQRVTDAINQEGLDCHMVVSGSTNLDIMPPGFGKGPATAFMAAVFGVSLDRLVVSGDSANDLDMFNVSKQCIAVGNACASLTKHLDPTRTYFAKQSHADGVLEGLRHWGAIRPTPKEAHTP